MSPGVQVTEFEPEISEKPTPGPVTDCCHLYSSVPDCPDGKEMLVIDDGVKLHIHSDRFQYYRLM